MPPDRCANPNPHRTHIRLPLGTCRRSYHVFFVTICTAERHPWFAHHPLLAGQTGAVINDLAAARGSTLHAWCVMPDHVHFVLADTDVVEYVRFLEGRTAIGARRIEPGRRLWQRSFHDHALRSGESLLAAVRYVLENPVRAAVVARAEAYCWSGSATWPDWRSWWSREATGETGRESGGETSQGGRG